MIFVFQTQLTFKVSAGQRQSMQDHSFVAATVIVPLWCMIDVFRNQLAGATEMIQILYYHYKI